MQVTLSFNKGKAHVRHNNRTAKENNQSWSDDLTDQNIVLVDETADKPLRQVYSDLFGEALEKYNQSQIEKGHAERAISDYYDKIKHSKQEKLTYGFIFQIGNADEIEKGSKEEQRCIECLKDLSDDFIKQYGSSLHVVQSIIHNDEKGIAHLHMVIIPTAKGGKRGLSLKNSLGGAFKDLGYGRNGFTAFREAVYARSLHLMENYSLEVKRGLNGLKMSHSEVQVVAERSNQLPQGKPEIQKTSLFGKEVPTGNVILTQSELSDLQALARKGIQHEVIQESLADGLKRNRDKSVKLKDRSHGIQVREEMVDEVFKANRLFAAENRDLRNKNKKLSEELQNTYHYLNIFQTFISYLKKYVPTVISDFFNSVKLMGGEDLSNHVKNQFEYIEKLDKNHQTKKKEEGSNTIGRGGRGRSL